MKIKTGDRVRWAGLDDWKVLGFHGDWAWVTRQDEKRPPCSAKVDQLKKVHAFFEKGRTYQRVAPWSIVAQRQNVTEQFDVHSVEYNGDGRAIAFGLLTITGHRPVRQWIILSPYDWDTEGWQDKGPM